MSEPAFEQVKSLSPEKRWSLACYFPLFNVLITLIVAVRKVDSDFCMFHARHGLVFFVLWFSTVFVALFSPILSLMLLGVVVMLYIFGAYKAFKGEIYTVPVLTSLAIRIPKAYIYTTLTGKIPDNNNLTK